MNNAEVQKSALAIKKAYSGDIPKIVLVLGSGLGKFAEKMTVKKVISYADIPDFPQPTVKGHEGKLIIGEVNGTPLLCMQGRMHIYEGHAAHKLAIPIRTFKTLGAEVIILTNAAGSLRLDMPSGSLMQISDHVNMSGHNPLIGPNDESFGQRFFPMNDAYDKNLQALMVEAAAEENLELFSGTYVQFAGPNFETPAEINMLRALKLDAVGMSTVPETLAAVHCGLKVAGLSVITNLGAGMAPHAPSHDETMAEGEKAYQKMSKLVINFIGKI